MTSTAALDWLWCSSSSKPAAKTENWLRTKEIMSSQRRKCKLMVCDASQCCDSVKMIYKMCSKKCWYSQTNIMEKTGLNVKRFNSFIEYSILYVKKIDTVYNSVISDLHGHLDEFWSPSTTPRGSHGVFLILVNAKSSFAEYWGNIAITLCDYFSLFSGAQHKPHTYF